MRVTRSEREGSVAPSARDARTFLRGASLGRNGEMGEGELRTDPSSPEIVFDAPATGRADPQDEEIALSAILAVTLVTVDSLYSTVFNSGGLVALFPFGRPARSSREPCPSWPGLSRPSR
jgi:hypothetical protein